MKQYRSFINAIRDAIDDAQSSIETIHGTTSFDADVVDSMDDMLHVLVTALADAKSLRDAMAEQLESGEE